MRVPHPQRRSESGVAYLALLLMVAVSQAVLAAGFSLWSQTQRRDREAQLLWAGDHIRRAIVAYHQHPDALGIQQYPRDMQDLLDDRRDPSPRRHLRRAYHDPLVHGGAWGLIRDTEGRLIGVYSRAPGRPLKQAGWGPGYEAFESAKAYHQWRFVAAPELHSPLAGDAAPMQDDHSGVSTTTR